MTKLTTATLLDHQVGIERPEKMAIAEKCMKQPEIFVSTYSEE